MTDSHDDLSPDRPTGNGHPDMTLVARIVRTAGVDCMHAADEAGDVLLAGRRHDAPNCGQWAARARREWPAGRTPHLRMTSRCCGWDRTTTA
jgi:hypothetical protein